MAGRRPGSEEGSAAEYREERYAALALLDTPPRGGSGSPRCSR